MNTRKEKSFLWINDVKPEDKIALKVVARKEGFTTLTGYLKWFIHNHIEIKFPMYKEEIQMEIKEYRKKQKNNSLQKPRYCFITLISNKKRHCYQQCPRIETKCIQYLPEKTEKVKLP